MRQWRIVATALLGAFVTLAVYFFSSPTPQFGLTYEARRKYTVVTMSIVQKALESFHYDNGFYPRKSEDGGRSAGACCEEYRLPGKV